MKLLALLILIGALCTPSFAQAVYVGPPSTTTYPATPPSNSAGTTGVPQYSKADGAILFDLLDPIPAGSNVIGAVTQSGAWAVTGTFWQATQPVSIAAMPTTPVTGTFWQSTQPASLTDGTNAISMIPGNSAVTSANNAVPITLRDTANVNSPGIIAPQTSYNISSTGTVATTTVTPGQTYSIAVQEPNISTAAVSVTPSSNTTVGSPTFSTASTTGVAVGQLASGAEVALGSYVASFVANTSITLSQNCITAASTAITFTAGSFSATPQYYNGTSWNTLTVYPYTTTVNQGAASAIATLGLYTFIAPQSAQQVRVNLTALTTIPSLNFYVDNFQSGQTIHLPYIGTTTSGDIPARTCVVPPIDTSGLSEIDIDPSLMGATVSPFQSSDPNLTGNSGALDVLPFFTISANPWTSATTQAATVSPMRVVPRELYFVLDMSTAGTLQFAGATAVVGAKATQEFPLTASSTVGITANSSVNVSQLGGSTANSNITAGSSKAALTTETGGVVVNPDLSAVSIASAQYTGATIAPVTGGGPSMSANIADTITTLGSCTGIQWSLQESWDSGTTWTTIWSSPMQTLTYPNLIVPPMPAPGRRRWITATLNNTAPTTATATITADDLSASVRPYHSYYDYNPAVLSGVANSTSFTGCSTTSGSTTVSSSTLTYANGLWLGEGVSGTNIPTGAYITGITSGTSITISLPASASGSSITLTTLAQTAPFYIDGCGNIRATVTCGAISTTAATYQIYIADTPNGPWFPVGTATQCVANKSTTLNVSGYPAEYAQLVCTTAGSGQTGVSVSLSAN